MKLENGFWWDDNRNRWEAESYTEEQAKACSETLSNCTICTDCKDCTNCVHCTGCTDCTGCSNCAHCSQCTDCEDCLNCTGCSHCMHCAQCANCKDSVGRRQSIRFSAYDKKKEIINMMHCITEYKGDMADGYGYEIDVTKLSKDIKTIRFYIAH